MPISKRDLLVKEIQDRLTELAEYDYLMGDIGVTTRPWHILDEDRDILEDDPDADWLAEGSLVVALAFQWGGRDGSHSIDENESKRIANMVRHLRSRSRRTEQIAQAFDMVLNEKDTERVALASAKILENFVKTR